MATRQLKKFVEAKVATAIGFLCTEALEAAMPTFKDANILVITVGVRTESVLDQHTNTGWPVFRFSPHGDAERNAVDTLLSKLWANELFAIIDDGTIYGRELADVFVLRLNRPG